LCLQQLTCPNPNVDTTISGTVSMPNGTLPLPNAIVYVPNGATGAPTYGVTAFPANVGCTTCGTPPSGSPLVSTMSDSTGKFVLHNMPVGSNIPLVIQSGRWRHKTTIANVAACTNTAVPITNTRLPSTQGGGDPADNIPLIAAVTGANDTAECLLRSVGVADNQFSDPTGGGRIRFYSGGGAVFSGGTPAESVLFASGTTVQAYDSVLLACHGTADAPTSAQKTVFTNYVNAGGRAIVDHLEYPWLAGNAPLNATATWDVQQSAPLDDPQAADIDTTSRKGEVLAEWLLGMNGSSTPGQVQVSHLAHDYDGVVSPAANWLAGSSSSTPLQFAFNTPVGAPPLQQCGRIAFLDHHPYYSANAAGLIFPSECPVGPLTAAQELAIYSFFDANNCVWPDMPNGSVGVAKGDRQTVNPGAVIRNLQAQVLASDGTHPYGVPVTFTVQTLSGDAVGSIASEISITDANGIATSPPMTVSGTAGVLKVTADANASAPTVFTVYVGDVIFYGGFDF
jgi:hypothetical protein